MLNAGGNHYGKDRHQQNHGLCGNVCGRQAESSGSVRVRGQRRRTGKAESRCFKANSEAAEWKRKHNALLGEDEKKKQEQEEKFANMEKELSELREAKRVSEFKAKFIAQGYDEALAEDTAKAMADGDSAKVFANQQKFLDEYTKQVKADALKKTPSPLPVPVAVLARWITPRKSRKHGQTVILPPLLTTPACKPKRKRRRKTSKGEFLLWQIRLL